MSDHPAELTDVDRVRLRLRELADAATHGPWTYDDGDGMVYAPFDSGGIEDYDEVARTCSGTTCDPAFIAAARTAVPALLDEVERLAEECAYLESDTALLKARQENQRLREGIEALADECASSGCIHLNDMWGHLRALLSTSSVRGES